MKLLAIDGNSVINRAFYGIKLLSTKNGRYTNAIYGFLNILLHLLEEHSPDGVVVAWDLKKPTFRHEMYKEYKAGRHAMPEELREQIPIMKELVALLAIRYSLSLTLRVLCCLPPRQAGPKAPFTTRRHFLKNTV